MDTPTEKNVNPVEGKKPATPKPPKKTEQSLRVKFTEEEVVKLARKLAGRSIFAAICQYQFFLLLHRSPA